MFAFADSSMLLVVANREAESPSAAVVRSRSVGQSELQLANGLVASADGVNLVASEIVRRRLHVGTRIPQCSDGPGNSGMQGALILR